MKLKFIDGKMNGIHYKYLKSSKKSHCILLLHGFTGDSSVYNEMVNLLKEKYSVLNIDLLGHGRSITPSKIDNYSFTSQASKIEQIIAKLKIRSLSIISYSYSCCLGRLISDHLKDNVKSLILISPYPKRNYNLLEKYIFGIGKFIWKYLLKDKEHNLDYPKIENYENPKLKDIRYILKSNNTKDLLGSALSFVKSDNSLKPVNNIPLLIIYGENDERFIREMEIFLRIPKVNLICLKNKNHLFLKTRAPHIAKSIDLFLTKNKFN